MSLEWLRNLDRSRPFFLMHHFKAPHDMFEFAARHADYLADTEIPEPASLYAQPDWGSPATRGIDDAMRGSIGSSLSMRNPPRSLGLRLGIDPGLPDDVFRHRVYQEYLKRYLRCVKGGRRKRRAACRSPQDVGGVGQYHHQLHQRPGHDAGRTRSDRQAVDVRRIHANAADLARSASGQCGSFGRCNHHQHRLCPPT